MTADKNKEISLIEYNHLNLPIKVHFVTEDESGKYIEYRYDALGTKVLKRVKDENQTSYHETYYAGGYIYEKQITAETASLKFIQQPSGYAEPNGNGEFVYTYQYKDHTSTMLSAGLGNIRLSYSDIDGNGVIDPTTEIKEAKDYYAFGLEHSVPSKQVIGTKHPYGYNGKEENNELGLEWLDFEARNYDATLGRWMNIDPLAEAMPDQSPYNYAFNNPVFWIDPDGRMPEEGDAGGGSDGGSSYSGQTTYSMRTITPDNKEIHTIETTSTQSFEETSEDGKNKNYCRLYYHHNY